MRRVLSLVLLSLVSVTGLRADYDPLATDKATPGQKDLTIEEAKRSREIPIRVYLPADKAAAPVVLFSHGLGGNREGSAFLGQHWARRGYAAVFLQHPGSDDRVWKYLPVAQRMAALKQAAGLKEFLLRVQDVTVVLDQLGADWLIKLQHPSGVFPFPVGAGLNPRDKVVKIVAKAILEHPEIVVNDWIPDDKTDGGLQFDNGLCGKALVSVWELTRDERYLAAARRAGDWAITRPIVSNWNYNAFSFGLLARLAEVTQDEEERETYLAAAVKKAEAGVLPGQMPGGRWFDAHNACAVYHNILLRELLELLHTLPPDHVFRPTLLDVVKRGLNQAADETLAHGVTGTWTDNFARGLLWIGENKSWRDAVNVNLNASGKNGAPTPGFAILPVFEGILKQEPKP